VALFIQVFLLRGDPANSGPVQDTLRGSVIQRNVTKVQPAVEESTSVPEMIRMSLQNAEGTVELFKQHYSGEFMRKRHLSEGEDEPRRFARLLVESAGAPDRE